MHGLRKSHLDGAGCELLPGRGSVVLGHDFGRGKKSGQKSQINEVSFHGVVVSFSLEINSIWWLALRVMRTSRSFSERYREDA